MRKYSILRVFETTVEAENIVEANQIARDLPDDQFIVVEEQVAEI